MPTFPGDAYNLLKTSIRDPNPVVFIEHRWLHNLEQETKIEEHTWSEKSSDLSIKVEEERSISC